MCSDNVVLCEQLAGSIRTHQSEIQQHEQSSLAQNSGVHGPGDNGVAPVEERRGTYSKPCAKKLHQDPNGMDEEMLSSIEVVCMNWAAGTLHDNPNVHPKEHPSCMTEWPLAGPAVGHVAITTAMCNLACHVDFRL